jgi:hypothetical protein
MCFQFMYYDERKYNFVTKNNLNRGFISYRYDRLLVKEETINHFVHKKMKVNSMTSIIC